MLSIRRPLARRPVGRPQPPPLTRKTDAIYDADLPRRERREGRDAGPGGVRGEMMKYNPELAKAGVLLSLDGLQASSKGARITWDAQREARRDRRTFHPRKVKEVIGGYWMIQVKSREEAIEWAKRIAPRRAQGRAPSDLRDDRLPPPTCRRWPSARGAGPTIERIREARPLIEARRRPRALRRRAGVLMDVRDGRGRRDPSGDRRLADRITRESSSRGSRRLVRDIGLAEESGPGRARDGARALARRWRPREPRGVADDGREEPAPSISCAKERWPGASTRSWKRDVTSCARRRRDGDRGRRGRRHRR